jgi:hypothetical protein
MITVSTLPAFFDPPNLNLVKKTANHMKNNNIAIMVRRKNR